MNIMNDAWDWACQFYVRVCNLCWIIWRVMNRTWYLQNANQQLKTWGHYQEFLRPKSPRWSMPRRVGRRGDGRRTGLTGTPRCTVKVFWTWKIWHPWPHHFFISSKVLKDDDDIIIIIIAISRKNISDLSISWKLSCGDRFSPRQTPVRNQAVPSIIKRQLRYMRHMCRCGTCAEHPQETNPTCWRQPDQKMIKIDQH